MAYSTSVKLELVESSNNRVVVRLSGLEHNPSKYNSFRFDLYRGRWTGPKQELTKQYSEGYRITSTSISFEFTNLSPSTRYIVTGGATYRGVLYWASINGTSGSHIDFTTSSTPPPTLPPRPIIIASNTYITHDTIGVEWDNTPNTIGYTVYLDGVSLGNTTNNYIVLTGLDPSTWYNIEVAAYNHVGTGPRTSASYRTHSPPDLEPPVILSFNVAPVYKGGNEYSISVNWAAYDNVQIGSAYISRSGPNSTQLTQLSGSWSGGGDTVIVSTDGNGNTFLGGNTYSFKIRVYDTSAKYSEKIISIRLDDNSLREWNWSYTIQSGGAFYDQQGTNAYLITAAEWNLFTERINQTRTYKGHWGNINFHTVSNDTPVTTVIINQAISAINGMLSPNEWISHTVIGEPVTASVFIGMRDALNIAIRRHVN